MMNCNTNTDDTSRYDDIMHLPHYVSKTHPQMTKQNRAAQFSPFAALTEYDAAVAETARLTDRKYDLTEDEKNALDERLRILMERIAEKPEVTVSYFLPDEKKAGGSYEIVSGYVRSVDVYERMLLFTDGMKIPIGDICRLEGGIFGFLETAEDRA